MMKKKKDQMMSAEEREIKLFMKYDTYEEFQKNEGTSYRAWKYFAKLHRELRADNFEIVNPEDL